jgi:hypothetical protein
MFLTQIILYMPTPFASYASSIIRGQTQYSLYNVDVNGYEANAGGEPPVDENHRRLLEVVEDEAEPPKMKDHRELRGITIFGDDVATLKFPGM